MQLSACIETLFAPEAASLVERMRLASEAGFSSVEFWHWKNRDIEEIDRARLNFGLNIAAFLAEPVVPLVDPAAHDRFIDGLAESVDVAKRLGTSILIAQAGDHIAQVSVSAQRSALVTCLKRAARLLQGTGVRLALEPLNTKIDHPGYFLSSTSLALDIVDEVGSPEICLLYDIYHSMVMGETTAEVLGNRVDRIAHLHVADAPGRHQPGSGTLELRKALNWLHVNGYSGSVGLEFWPNRPTTLALQDTLSYLRQADFGLPKISGA